jgi:hypothetical protein
VLSLFLRRWLSGAKEKSLRENGLSRYDYTVLWYDGGGGLGYYYLSNFIVLLYLSYCNI